MLLLAPFGRSAAISVVLCKISLTKLGLTLPVLRSMVVNIHFYHIWKPSWRISIFNKMAAARSPCGGFKTRVLHFKLRYTVKRQKRYRGSSKNAQFSFCGGREAFHQEIVLRGIQTCFLHGEAGGLFWNATCKAEKFLPNSQVHFAPCGQENFLFFKEIYVFINVSYTFHTFFLRR